MLTRTVVILSIVFGCCFTPLLGNAQTKVMFNSNTLSCDNSNIEIPVIGENLSDVTSFTFRIHVDTTHIVFDSLGYKNDALLYGGVLKFNFSAQSQNIIVSWFTASPSFAVQMSKDTLFTLVMKVKQANTPLHFNDCEMSDNQMPPQIIQDIEYIDGYLQDSQQVQPQAVTITPEQQQVVNQGTVTITVSHDFSNVRDYYWQVKENETWNSINNVALYQGIYSPQLTIFANDTSLNGTQYRCLMSVGTSNNCFVTSPISTLHVVTEDGMEEWNKEEDIKIYAINSNAEDNGKIIVELKKAYASFEVQCIDLNGNVRLKKIKEKVHANSKVSFTTENLPNGLYAICCFSSGKLLKIRKIIK